MSTEYHKIQTVFKRDPETKFRTLSEGDYSIPEFEYLAENLWVFTEKVDGTNIRVEFDGQRVAFKGKTDKASIPGPLLERLGERFSPDGTPLEAFGDKFASGVVLYGEGYGPKIQKGGSYREDQDFVLFDVRVGPWWLGRGSVEEIGEVLGIDVVPLTGCGSLKEMVSYARSGIKSAWGDFAAEGLVARPSCELMTRGGERIITKIKTRDFPQDAHD